MNEGKRSVTLGIPQVGVALFLFVTIAGIFGTVTYSAGRMTCRQPAAVAHAPTPVTESPMVEARAEVAPVDAGVTTTKPCGELSSEPAFLEPAAGEVYLQAMATNRGLAAMFVEYLRWRGYPSGYAAGPREETFRVLVGPIADAARLAEFKSRLEEDGFLPFRRTYGPQGHSLPATNAGEPES